MNEERIVTQWDSYDKHESRSLRDKAKVLTSYDEVPLGFRADFAAPSATFPYTIFLPQATGGLFQKKPAQLIWLQDGSLIHLKVMGDTVVTASYPLESIYYLEYGRILLRSWLTLQFATDSATISFNTINHNNFQPIVDAIRSVSPPLSSIPEVHNDELDKLSFLSSLNYKYMNFGRNSVMPGDTIVHTAYQPEVCLKTVKIFGKTLLTHYTTPHLFILTDRELIHLQEDVRTKLGENIRHGGIVTYIPRRQIKNLSFQQVTGSTRGTIFIVFSDSMCLHTEFLSNTTDAKALISDFLDNAPESMI